MQGTSETPSKVSRKKRFFGMRWKLLVSFGLLVLGTLVLIFSIRSFGLPFTSFKGANEAALEAEFRNLSLVADLKQDRLVFWLAERKTDAWFWSHTALVERSAQQLSEFIRKEHIFGEDHAKIIAEITDQESYRVLTEYLQLILETYSAYRKIQVADATNGQILASTDGAKVASFIADPDIIHKAASSPQGIYLEVSTPFHDQQPYLTICSVIPERFAKDSGLPRPVGALLLYVEMNDFVKPLIYSGEGLGKTGEVILVDQNQRVLMSPRYSMPDGSRRNVLDTIDSVPISLALTGKDGIVLTPDYRGVSTVAAYRHVMADPDRIWGLVVKRDETEVLGPLQRSLTYSFSIALVGTMLSLIVAGFIATRISRPIVAMANTARLVEAGNLQARAPVTTSDEVGMLAQSFNSMVERLQNWHNKLEEKVRVRTADLNDANKTLMESIEQRKLAQEALRSSEKELSLTLDATTQGIWKWNFKTNELLFSDRYYQMLGYEPGEFPASLESWKALIHPDNLERALEIAEQYLKTKPDSYQNEFLLRQKNGEYRWIQARGRVVERDESGGPVLMIGNHEDITERKMFEKDLNLQKNRFQMLAENSPFGMVIIQPNGTFSYANPKFEEMFGYDLSEVPNGKMWLKKAYPDNRYRHEVVSAWIEDFNGATPGETRTRVFTVTCKDKTEKIILFRPVKLDSGEDLTTCEDITDIKRAEEEIRRTKALLDSIIQNLPTAVFLKDAEELKFALWNKASEHLYGHKADAILGKTAKDVFLEAEAARFEQQDREVLNTGQFMEIPEQHVTTHNNAVRILHTKKVPIIGEDGKPSHLLGLGEDITARKTAEQELLKAKTVAEEASRAKSEFLANMSHEIRTPMNGIIGMTELALHTELNDEQREYLEAVKISADSLLTLINDILDFSKIEAGKLELVPMDFSLRDCVANTLITLALNAHKKGLELLYDIPAEIPDGVIGDPGRLRQIFVNLVGNAIKFTAQGEIAVEARLESETDSDVCLQFSVTDTGIGIPADKQDKIFGAFEQADGSTTRNYGGTGLGLAVSTQLVHMMGGRIWVESEVGRGSTFRFTVRLEFQSEPTGITLCQDSSNLKDLPVLVVDDNATNRRILEQMLVSWNMKPVSVDHGAAAIEEMKRAHERGTPFEVVLIDYMMPDIDGFRLAERIKGDPELNAATLIMLTSAGERGHAARCLEVGISAYLMKPVRQSELLETICSTLRKTTMKGRPTLLTRHAIRESKLRLNILLAEDNPVNQKLASRLLQKMGHSVTVVENGRQALEAFLKDQYDAILMDIQMPEMDGFEATAAIREREKSQEETHVPILAMTAHAMRGDRERCLEAGMDGYVSKPINVQELAEALENLTTRSESTD